MIHKITPSVDYNQQSKRLDTQLDKPTNQNSVKVPKVVMPKNKKTLLQIFVDQCNKQPIIPSLMLVCCHGFDYSCSPLWRLVFPNANFVPFFLHILAVGLYNHFNYIKLNHIILGTKNEVLFYRFLIRWLHDFGEFDRMVH